MTLPVVKPGAEAARIVNVYAHPDCYPSDLVEVTVGITPDGAVDITWTSEPNRRETVVCEPDDVTAINLRGLLLAAMEGMIR